MKKGNNIFWVLSLLLIVFVSCKGQENTNKKTKNKTVKVLADSISINTVFLPEFKIDIHLDEPQGNPISGVVRTMIQDKNSLLWFGTQNGLLHLKDEILDYYDIKDDFGNTITIKALCEDVYGNIWIGHDNGISKYDGTYFTNYTKKMA